ncbi:hypothetical protein [Flagellimonas aurea]|uniref:hypothetical protein n=1 Tax=Flagellimonas aurea TaxID=2915619 RepID=UPI0035CFB4DB
MNTTTDHEQKFFPIRPRTNHQPTESLEAMQKVLGGLRNQNDRLERSNQKLRKRISEYE